MINSRKIRNAGRTKPLAMAVVSAVIVLTTGFPDSVGVKSWFDSSRHALLPSERHPVAKVIAVSGSASVLWAGRSHPLATGNELAAGEVVVTNPGSRVLVETADGGVYDIFPESRVRFRENRWTWLGQVDRFLDRIRRHVQHLGGPPSCDRLSCPTAVISVRAASLPFPARGVAEFAKHWIWMRS